MPKVWNVRDPRRPDDAVYIGRGMPGWKASPWANPYRIDRTHTREMVLMSYRLWVTEQIKRGALNPEELRGKDLVCWCAPASCHGDILIELANTQKGEA